VGDLASCVAIPGATLTTYHPIVGDIGFSIRVWITGSNIAGSDVGVTNHTFPIVDKQHFSPSTVSAPTIAGTMEAGRQLTASIGTFDGDDPIGTSFVWQRCDATGAACHTILGAKKVVYHPTEADLGATLRLAVTAKNAYGTLVSMSDPTEPVLASPPHRRGRRIVGTRRGEYLAGGGYDDVILGMLGNDTLLGGAGADRLDGGLGKDVLTGGSGADRILGGPGSDTIYAADGERDVIDCGDGRDRAIVDSVDIVKNCEVVQQATSPSANPSPPSTPTPDPGTGDTP
jgi:Ca2+-binding RTX toxin-like protein